MEIDRSSNYSDENGRDTPKEGFEVPTRDDTPGPMPEYVYDRKKLLDLEQSKASKIRPDCLSKDFDTPDGLWDPERWFRSFDNSHGNSPLTIGDRKKPSDLDKDFLARRRPSDPKDRLKEEKDGIVLSPQRRSFGTGCHVSHMPLGRQLSVPGQETGERDRERISGRRIGSGRIQIDRDRERDRSDYREARERGDREYRDPRDRNERDRGERDFRDLRERGDRDFRDNRDRDFRDKHDRGERDFRAIKDRFDDRDRDRRFDRDNRGYNRRDYDDRRDFSDRGHYNYRPHRDSYRNREEDEPEWFTEGPTSQRDTIELHGFEKSEKRRSKTPTEEEEKSKEKRSSTKGEKKDKEKSRTPEVEESKPRRTAKERKTSVKESEKIQTPARKMEEDEEMQEHNKTGVSSVADRNGSLETNEPSSPEECNTSDSINVPSPHNNLFDINEFFKIENIPGIYEGSSPTAELTGLQSRFSKWFASTSRDNSRRSSINEDFGYLNDLLSGSKSPIIPSPPPPSANSLYNQSLFSTSANSTFADKPQHQSFDFAAIQKTTIGPMLNAIFQNSQASLEKSPHGGNISMQDAELQLKALLFGRKGSTPSSSGTGSPAVASPLNLPGRVKTVSELEADMKPPPPSRSYPVAQQPMHRPVPERPLLPQRNPSPQLRPSSPRDRQEEDLTAFNKLLSLMKAGAAAAVESPKMPINVSRPDQRPVSPNMGHPLPGTMPYISPSQPTPPGTTPAQNEFLQALIRNKEQQLQIRQQTLSQMRVQGGVKQSTPIATPPVQRGQPHPQQQNLQNMGSTPALNLPDTNIPPSPSSVPPTAPGVQEDEANSDSISNFIKQNPTIITKPSTPTPPPALQQEPQLPPIVIQGQPPPPHMGGQQIMALMGNTSTPRAPSPSALAAQNLLQQPSSPRVPSPIMFSQQPPMHLSAPSPIHPSQVGGATTPVSMATATTLSSSNTIRPPSIPRVPSPQELIAHTQAIMQTALLKKQLEDQKERFIRKQQERGKSPNTMGPSPQPGQMQQKPYPSPITSTGGMPATPMSSANQQQTKTSMSQAFTPTSVIRKMHSDKAEKMKQDSLDGDDVSSPAPKPPIKQIGKQEDTENHIDPARQAEEGVNKSDEQTANQRNNNIPVSFSQPPPTVTQGGGKATHPTSMGPMTMPPMTVPPPPLPGMSAPPPPLMNRAMSQDQSSMSGEQMMQAMLANEKMRMKMVNQGMTPGNLPGQQGMMTPGQQGVPPQLHSLTASAPPMGRAIVKGIGGSIGATPTSSQLPITQPGTSLPPSIQQLVKGENAQTPTQRPIIGGGGTPITSAGVDIAKVLQQRQVNISPNPLTRPAVGGVTPGLPLGIPITARVPIQPPVSMSANPLYMQQVMAQRGLSPGVNVNQLNHLALQQQQRMMDPRLQGMRGVYPPTLPGLTPRGIPPNSGLAIPNASPVAISRALSPKGPTQKPLLNGPISPGNPGIVNGNNNITKQGDPNLMKWFGKEVLKNQLPSMPPLPAQGQKVMTVDEIERCQQAVSN